jgi:hypothetical protein
MENDAEKEILHLNDKKGETMKVLRNIGTVAFVVGLFIAVFVGTAAELLVYGTAVKLS